MYRLFKKLLFNSISIRLYAVLLGFISNVLISRSLGVVLKGEYTTIFTYSNFLQTALNFGLTFSFVPLSNKYGKEVSRRFLSSFSVAQALIYSAFAFIVSLVSRDSAVIFTSVLAVLLIFNGQIVFMALLDDIKKRNLTLLASAFLYVIANFFIYFFVRGNLSVILVCYAFKIFFESAACYKWAHFSFSFKSMRNKAMFVDALHWGLPTAVLALLISFNYNVDVFLLDTFQASEYEIGLFGTAISLANIMWFVPDAFKEYVYNKSAHGNFAVLTAGLVIINMALCIIICIGFFFLGELFLRVMYGESFIPAFLTTEILFIGVVPMVAFKLIHPIYVNEGKSLTVVAFLALSIGANIVAASILIPLYGSLGASVSTVLSYSLCGGMFFIKYSKDWGIGIAEIVSGIRMLLQRN